MSYRDLILADSPAGYWRLNETSGTTAADQTGANAGTYSSTGVSLNNGAAIAGDSAANSVHFDGSTGNCIASGVSLTAGSPASIEFWVYVASADLTRNQSIFRIGSSDIPNRCSSDWPYGGIFDFDFGSYSGGRTSLTAGYAGAWHHVCMVAGASSQAYQAIYIDGAVVASQASSQSTTVTQTGLLIGGGYGGPGKLAVAEFSLYSRVLSPSRILAHYQQGAGIWARPNWIPVTRRITDEAGEEFSRGRRLPLIVRPPSFFFFPVLPRPVRVWPAEQFEPDRRPRTFGPPPIRFDTWGSTGRGQYRVFNTAGYRFFRSSSRPPLTTDTPFATNASLPYQPSATYADGTWYLSVSYFDGVLDSGFLPLGPGGETYRIVTISGGVLVATPPSAPTAPALTDFGAGIAKITAVYSPGPDGTNAATQWAIAYTTDGSTPPAGTPTITQVMTAGPMQVLSYALPAQANGTTVKVQLQVRRSDGSGGWVYSAAAAVLSVKVSTTGPAAAEGISDWPGQT